jgi:D-alanine-D-alanine ligase
MEEKNKKIVFAVGKEKLARAEVELVEQCLQAVENVIKAQGVLTARLYLELAEFSNKPALKSKIQEFNPACVFNLFEGFTLDSTKEPDFIKILEELKIPFTGNGYRALCLCLNKKRTKDILRRNGIFTPRGKVVVSVEDLAKIKLDFPLFVKPAMEDASLGVDNDSLVRNQEELAVAVAKKLKNFPRGLVVEEFIAGKEYSAGFVGNFPYELLGISVIDYSKYDDFSPFLTYGSKWNVHSPEYKAIVPSLSESIDEEIRNKIFEITALAGKILGCKGYFRIDMREKAGRIYVLDVNPNPDISPDSGFICQAQHKGYSYSQVIEKILHAALSGNP